MNGRNSLDEPIMGYGKVDYHEYKRQVYLGHSCDEWIIGTVKEAERFIKKLQVLVDKAKASPNKDIEPNDE